MRGRIHNVCDELERTKSEQRILVLQESGGGAATAAGPVDLAGAVETMRTDFDSMFNDPLLPPTAKAKGAEAEAGFVTMANLVTMLSALSAEYKAARLSAPPVAPAAKASPPPPPKQPQDPPAAEAATKVEEGGGAATVGEDAKDGTAQAAEDVIVVASQSEARGSKDGNRDIKRDRTPPPGKATQKIAKMSDEELLGPRRSKA